MSSIGTAQTSRLTDLQKKLIHEWTISVLSRIEAHKKSCTDPNCHLEVALRA